MDHSEAVRELRHIAMIRGRQAAELRALHGSPDEKADQARRADDCAGSAAALLATVDFLEGGAQQAEALRGSGTQQAAALRGRGMGSGTDG